MIPLFDMMMQAQNGHAMEVMAKQFGLAQEQMAKATAALMPAFSTAMKRNAADPYDFGAFLTAMTSGNHAKYFEDMTKAFTPQGMADGNGLLGQLFGSKEVSRAVAAQAAQMTGIGQEIYKQMLPVMATTLMGGLFKQATGQMGNIGNPFAGTPMDAMMKPWLEASGFAKKQEPMASPFDNPFTQAMQNYFGMAKSHDKQQTAPDMFATNPFMTMFQQMMNGVPSPQQPKTPDEKTSTNAYTDMFNAMFDSGLEAQKEYQKNIDSLFDTYRNNAKP